MLLARYDSNVNQCDTLDLSGANAPTIDPADFDEAVWDFSGQDLTEFAISDDDADKLKILHGADDTADATDSIAAPAVRYIDLTGNPLSIDDVSFANIPSSIAVILSADSNVNGFQSAEQTVTEGAASYVAVAFPAVTIPAGESRISPELTISGRDATRSFDSTTGQPFTSGTHVQLIDLGNETATATSDVAARTAVINSVSDGKIYYLPLQVSKNNDNDEEWDFTITISEVNDQSDTPITGHELTNDEIDITVLDADAPALSVCDRSEDVEAAILALADAASGDETYGGNTKCDDLTLRDLGAVPGLSVVDADGDLEPIADLISGDFEGLSNAATLSITGARTLPSGIFAGVGKDAANGVQISFSKNTSDDEDVDNVGNYTPSTIPQHIFDDQEAKQVIILADDLNDDDEGVTSGLDATAYSVDEGSQFFVLTPATQTYYLLGKSATVDGATDINTPTITDRGDANNPKVARYAAPMTNKDLDDDNGDDESLVLFLFDSLTPASADNLVDIAAVTVIDDD